LEEELNSVRAELAAHLERANDAARTHAATLSSEVTLTDELAEARASAVALREAAVVAQRAATAAEEERRRSAAEAASTSALVAAAAAAAAAEHGDSSRETQEELTALRASESALRADVDEIQRTAAAADAKWRARIEAAARESSSREAKLEADLIAARANESALREEAASARAERLAAADAAAAAPPAELGAPAEAEAAAAEIEEQLARDLAESRATEARLAKQIANANGKTDLAQAESERLRSKLASETTAVNEAVRLADNASTQLDKALSDFAMESAARSSDAHEAEEREAALRTDLDDAIAARDSLLNATHDDGDLRLLVELHQQGVHELHAQAAAHAKTVDGITAEHAASRQALVEVAATQMREAAEEHERVVTLERNRVKEAMDLAMSMKQAFVKEKQRHVKDGTL